MRLLQVGDILIEQATGLEYKVWWTSKARCTARMYYYKNEVSKIIKFTDINFIRDTSKGIRTYPKSDRVFTLKQTDTI